MPALATTIAAVPRVLLVYQPIDGGVGRHVGDLSRGLLERGYEVITCGPSPPRGCAGGEPHYEHVSLDLRRAIAPGADARALRELVGIVRRARPDLIHAHSSKAGALARLARMLGVRRPLLYTPHGYAFAGFFTSELERRVYKELERTLAPLATRVVCVCKAEARLAASVGLKRRVRVVYNGISPMSDGSTDCLVDPRMAALGRRGPVVCALTQLRAGKGIETLIDATAGVLTRIPDAQVAIWGDGPELETLRARAADAGVADSVHFPGASTSPLSVLRGADLFVHPSLAESFPYVILEAMSVGTPILASDVGGIGEALADGRCGMLVPPADDRALTQALLDTLADVDQRRELGRAARARFEQRFTLAKMLDQLTAVYGEVCTACR